MVANKKRDPPQPPTSEDGRRRKLVAERQQETLDFIRKYVSEHGVAPSRPEIADALGLTHKSTVDAHRSALMKKGWIELRPGSAQVEAQQRGEQGLYPRVAEAQGRGALTVDVCAGRWRSLKRFGSDGAVVADGLDAEQASVGSEADLFQPGSRWVAGGIRSSESVQDCAM